MLNVARQQKKNARGKLLLRLDVYVVVAEEDHAMQRALAEASTTECDEGSNPVEYSESLAPSVFF